MFKKIERILTNITTPVGCKKINGKWDRENRLCIQYTNNKNYGITAPIRGIIFAYWINKTEEEWPDIDDDYKGMYIPRAIGCPMDQMEILPEHEWFVCQHSIFDNLENIDVELVLDKNPETAFLMAKEDALSVAKDVKEGRAGDWSMSYVDKKGKPTCIGPRCHSVISAGRNLFGWQPFPEKKYKKFSFRRSTK